VLLILCSSDRQWNPLHLAAMDGHTEACQLLIANKADVNATDECAIMFEMSY
jgi:ankyrin repeat protein